MAEIVHAYFFKDLSQSHPELTFQPSCQALSLKLTFSPIPNLGRLVITINNFVNLFGGTAGLERFCELAPHVAPLILSLFGQNFFPCQQLIDEGGNRIQKVTFFKTSLRFQINRIKGSHDLFFTDLSSIIFLDLLLKNVEIDYLFGRTRLGLRSSLHLFIKLY
jgi:hypothetical protein